MEPSAAAREWGRRQAAASPRWSEEKWQRIAALLGMRLTPASTSPNREDSEQRSEAA